MTYEASANGDVEDEVLRRRGERIPDIDVVDAATRDLHELVTVAVPGDGLVDPVRGGAVDDDAPRVPAVVGDSDGPADAAVLVADTAGSHIAVHRAVSRQLPVDHLEDIDLATLRPGGAVSDRVTQKPERRPDTLLLRGGVVSEPDLSLEKGPPAVRWREDVLGLQTGGCPLPVVVLRHDLDCSTS